jgi:hypothetical protein
VVLVGSSGEVRRHAEPQEDSREVFRRPAVPKNQRDGEELRVTGGRETGCRSYQPVEVVADVELLEEQINELP